MAKYIHLFVVIVGFIAFSAVSGSARNDAWFERVCAIYANAHNACKSAIAINQSLDLLTVYRVEFLTTHSSGGEVSVYKSKQKAIRKATMVYHGEMGKEILNFYFQHSKIILINRELILYSRNPPSQNIRNQEVERASYVLKHNQIVTVLDIAGDSAPTASDKIWLEQALADIHQKLKGV